MARKKNKTYTACDGKLVLTLEDAKEGGFIVRSPMDPAMLTQADSLGEAFAMARDVLKELRKTRAMLATQRRKRKGTLRVTR
ncbi:MAG: type II toxin-antitoxin system HicB family antitoxin [Phycisphaerales bacterium]